MFENVHISLLGKNEIAREGLRKILSSENFRIRDSSADVAAILASAKDSTIDCNAHVIVIDAGYGNEGLDSCRYLAAGGSEAKLVLLADRYVFNDVATAFQSGVDAVIVKEISCEPLIESIRLVAMGEKVFPSQLANDLVNCSPSAETGDWRNSAAECGISAREIEILESIMTGMSNKVIARQFDICEATVKVHVKAILRKLGVDNRTQAATWAVKHSMGNTPSLAGSGFDSGAADMRAMPHYGQAA
jgi:two-component system, NarL family, nitrate/nitrite response regulator NarL